jgi:hypothetical protein
LQSIGPVQGNNTTDDNLTDDKSEEESDFGAELTAGVIILCFMAIYILLRLSKFPYYIKNRKNDLYIFMYFANNGTLIASGINIIIIFDSYSDILYQILNYGPLLLTSLIYIIGGLFFIVNLVKGNCIPEQFFSSELLSSITKLPCFVGKLIPLADYCCMCTTQIIYYADGHNENDDTCCVCMWNFFFKSLKFIFYIYSIISFYIFYIAFIIGWLIAKLIYLIVLILIKVLCFRKNENNISQNDASQAEDQNDTNRTESLNVTNQGEVQNDTNQTDIQNSINQAEGQNDIHQAEGQIIDNPITQSESIIVNINNNININQNSPNEKINKPNKKQMKNIDYLNDEEIHQKLNLSINRELNKSEKSQGNPTPNKVDNVNQNPINQLLANSD